jgi:tRNA threonylcarbamoyladenosine biosynthesis protein TsaB
MPRVLAIDTTAELGSLAFYDGGVLHEISMHSPDGFGHILFERIGTLLDRAGVRTNDVDCFASASGPGSFTGVRVGLTAAKGLAEAAGKPVVAVSNLRALASFGTGPLRATVLDARRGEVYGAVYGADLEIVQPERVIAFPAWLEGLPEGEIEFISSNFAPFRAALEASRFRGARIAQASGTLAGAVAQIAHSEYLAGRAATPAAVDANYVRRSDAELLWKDRD